GAARQGSGRVVRVAAVGGAPPDGRVGADLNGVLVSAGQIGGLVNAVLYVVPRVAPRPCAGPVTRLIDPKGDGWVARGACPGDAVQRPLVLGDEVVSRGDARLCLAEHGDVVANLGRTGVPIAVAVVSARLVGHRLAVTEVARLNGVARRAIDLGA